MEPVSLFDLAAKQAQWLSVRQSAIAGNIANANTPGYRRKDVDFHDTLRAAFAQGADQAPQALDNVSFTTQTDSNGVMQADGNGVDIDVENADLAKNGLEYESLVTVARARIDILKYAMGTP